MIIICSRGQDYFIVKETDTYYLVDLMKNEAVESTPPDNPDIFLKSGGWEEAGEIDDKTMAEIQEAMTHLRRPML